MTAPTIYHLRNNDGVETFTGTITPAPGGGSQPVKSYRALITNADLTLGQDHVDLPFTIPADEVIVYTSATLLETFDDGGMFDPANLVAGPSQSIVVGPDFNLLDAPDVPGAEGLTVGKSATGNGTGNVGDDALGRPFPIVPSTDPVQLAIAVGNVAGDGATGQVLVIVLTVPKAPTV